MSQSRLQSFVEAWANTFIGYFINLAVQLIVYPFYGATFSLGQNIQIGLIFMAVSISRSYLLRRAFNWRVATMSKNDITTKASTDAYREGHDRIWRKPCPECNGVGVIVDTVDATVNNDRITKPIAQNVQTSKAR